MPLCGGSFIHTRAVSEDRFLHTRAVSEDRCSRFQMKINTSTTLVSTFKGIVNILFTDEEDEKPTKVFHYDELWELFDE